jgi:hypothetical protein
MVLLFLIMPFFPSEIPEEKSNTSTEESEGSTEEEFNSEISDKKG